MVGKTLAHYKIIEMIGKGGMGDVYRARDTKLDRDVALKILPFNTTQALTQTQVQSKENKQRFEREAKAIAALKHPNIVTIYSVEEAEDVHFITMELIEGHLLSDILPDQGLSLERFFKIVLPLTEALGSAHSKGITHRDIKPDNIMFDQDNRLKVLDFGLAKQKISPSDTIGSQSPSQDSITMPGAIIGTVAYMSPEQITGATVDCRSDIFSLGVIFHELLSGVRPFQGDYFAAILYNIVNIEISPLPSLPKELSGVITRCLLKEPNERFSNANELRSALLVAAGKSDVYLPQETIVSPNLDNKLLPGHNTPPHLLDEAKDKHEFRYDVFLSYARENKPVARKLAEKLKQNGFSVWWDSDILPGAQFTESIETSLKQAACVVVIWSKNSVTSRYVRNEAEYGANRGKLVPVMIEEVSIPWEVSNFQTMDLKKWAVDYNENDFAQLVEGLRFQLGDTVGNTPVIRDHITQTGPVAHKASKKRTPVLVLMAMLVVALLGSWYLSQNPMTSDEATSITDNWQLKHIPLTGDGKSFSTALSPNGNLLVYANNNHGKYSLRVKQVEEGNESVLVAEKQQGIRSPIFSPDGSMVYFSMIGPNYSTNPSAEYDLYRIPILGGKPQKVIDRIIGLRFDISPSGKQLVFKKTHGDSIFVMTANSDGSNQQTIAAGIKDISVRCNLSWSPDGQRVYSTAKDTASGKTKIISIPINGSPVDDFSTGTWQAVMDLCSLPDDSGLLISGMPSDRSDDLNLNIYFQARGATMPIQLTNDLTKYLQISLDQKGSRIALTHYATKRILRILAASDPNSYKDISTDVVSNGKIAWIAPGQLLVNQQVGSRVGLVKITTDGKAKSPLVSNENFIFQMASSPDGQHLAFTSFYKGDTSIHISDGDGNTPRLLSEELGLEQFPIFSSDSRSLFYCLKTKSEPYFILRHYSLETESSKRLCDVPALNPEISPDGSRILAFFMDKEAGGYRLGTIPTDGGIPIYFEIPKSFEAITWNPTGDGLTCYNSDGSTINLWNINLTGGEPTQLTFFPPGHKRITGIAWNAAGDSLAVALENTTFDAVLLETTAP